MLALNKCVSFENDLPLKVSVQCITHQEAHYHENAIEILIVLKGTINLRSSHRYVTLHKGDTFSMDPGDIHCIYSDIDNLVLLAHINIINNRYTIERMRNCFFAYETQNINVHQLEALYKASDLMLAAGLESSKPNNMVSSNTLINLSDKLLEILVKHFDWLSFMWDPTDSNPILQERFYRIISYCQSNYKDKISISMLAQKEHFNENYFSTLMKKTSFGGFSNMVNFFRCDGAERLLLTTDLSIVDISSNCGFSDPKYFYKHFNMWWGLRPAKLKQWYKEYSKADRDVHILSHNEALAVIKDYLADYHQKKVMIL